MIGTYNLAFRLQKFQFKFILRSWINQITWPNSYKRPCKITFWFYKMSSFKFGKYNIKRQRTSVNFVWVKILQKILQLHPEKSFFESKKHFFDIRSKNKFVWIKESFVDFKNISLMWTNLFLWIKENYFEITKLSLIQRNFFVDRIFKHFLYIHIHIHIRRKFICENLIKSWVKLGHSDFLRKLKVFCVFI